MNPLSPHNYQAKRLQFGASICLIALILLCIAWESVLAPLKPNGSLLILKALPLLIPLFGILKGRRYTYQWAGMLILFYFTEGVVRAWSDTGLSSQLALMEVVLSLIFFLCAIFYAKLTRNNALKGAA
ncbi:MAG: hypothetical protein CTY10_05290 [Methylotenera sp.]|nr:MAG: hypothetical protein BVN34_01850 [Proteobacteria bacterium ST_bin12]PPD56214.1 MAG: hypothetical protein CTY10_05290 [Methylotenera sp.]